MANHLKNYINGKWVEPKTSRYLDVYNPSTGEVMAQVPLSTNADVDAAAEAAAVAFEDWRFVPVGRRVFHLQQLLHLLRGHEEQIVRVIAEEAGKSLPDARAEMKRVFDNIEVACSAPMLQQGCKLPGVSVGVDVETIRQPVGVFAMVAPFNFPAMVPFWFLPYAIAAGNTMVLKPSEKAPCTMQLVTEYIQKVDLPPGVFNLVNGDSEAATLLIEHERVKGVSIVGSTRVVHQVAVKCAELNKRCQAMGGAKNHLVVMPDADFEKAIGNMISSGYGCSGQRCMAASAIVCVGDDTHDEVCSRFLEASRRVVVANPLDERVKDEPIVMGPVISAEAKEFILSMIDIGVKEGATLALDGRKHPSVIGNNGYFIGPTVFTDVKPGMKIHTTEIFGPVVAILRVSTLDEAIEIINNHQYGNGASIYTRSTYYARKFKMETNAGMLGINVGIPAPVAYFPFGGTRASLFSEIKAQGSSAFSFFTEEKVCTERFTA